MGSASGMNGAIYHSYLLRLWQVPGNGGHTWRILLEIIPTGEKVGFTNIEDFIAYLQQQTRSENNASDEGI